LVSVILAGSMVCGFAAAAFAPAPRQPVANGLQVLIGMTAPVAFCVVMALTSAGEREAGAVAMWVLAASLAALLWVLRAPSGENGPDSDDSDDDDGGTGRRKPSGGPGNPDDGLSWDWDRFETDFASYAARSSSDRELAGVH
jgi:hypothetical protein